MGASQSSQPPSRHNSRHGEHRLHRQKAASISVPMKPSLPVVIDKPGKSAVASKVVQSVPAVAVPIPGKKKPTSLPGSGENSYVDQHKDVELLHRLEELKLKEGDEGPDDTDGQSKFGIAWGGSGDLEEEVQDKDYRATKYPLTIKWSGGGKEVFVLGTFTERKALPMKKTGGVFVKTVDAEPGGHRFRFIVDGDSRTSAKYKLATDHQNIVVNYLDHIKPDYSSEVGSYESYHSDYEAFPPIRDIWTREIPFYVQRQRNHTPSPSSSHSSDSSTLSRFISMTQLPAALKRHPINSPATMKEDQSVLTQPSHALLGHLGVRGSTNDGLIATTITTRYKHKFVTTVLYRSIDENE